MRPSLPAIFAGHARAPPRPSHLHERAPMNITHAQTPDDSAAPRESFEAVDVPAIQAEIQERKLENLPAGNLCSREVLDHGKDDGVIDATVADAASRPAQPDPHAQEPQVVQTTPGRPTTLGRP